MARKIQILDTTLRDGNKLPFVVLSSDDRLILARRLSLLGVDIIEAGFPVSSGEEAECVSRISREVHGPFISALARALTRDVERTLEVLREAEKPYLHIFMPISPASLNGVVKMSESQAVRNMAECVAAAKKAGVTVQISLSEAPQGRPDFRDALCRAAGEAGADVINFADTNGVLVPEDAKAMVEAALVLFSGGQAPAIGIHCHNDLGLAAANTFSAIRAGASHAEVTIGGFGERAGNAALEEIAFLISAFSERFSICHGIELSKIAGTSELFNELTGIHTHPNKPVIGRNALVPTADAGSRSLDPSLRELLNETTIGRRGGEYTPVESAEKSSGAGPAEPYRLESFNVVTGSHSPPVGIVVIERDGDRLIQSSHGSGPIDALFKAVDRALGFSPKLVFYSLYTLATGPDAAAEVTVTTELKGHRFHGRHRSTDVIEASLRAYMSACNAAGRSGIMDGRLNHYVQGEYLWE
jgi:2-isopropylmalate synthase